LKFYWDNFKEISKNYLSKKIIQKIESNCSVLEIYGKEYCKGNIEESLYKLI